jgi:transposase
MHELLAAVDHHCIVNCDETAWRVIPSGLLTWARVGEDSVSGALDGNDKESITALASVTASYEKLPLFLIAKGKTQRVEQTQLGDVHQHHGTHSASGWTTAETFSEYLTWLRSLYADNDEIHLVLDCFSVHRSREARELADELRIRLHFIPPGWTDELQPLDRYVFGALKSMCRRLFQRYCQECQARLKRVDAVGFLVEAWDRLEARVIEKG